MEPYRESYERVMEVYMNRYKEKSELLPKTVERAIGFVKTTNDPTIKNLTDIMQQELVLERGKNDHYLGGGDNSQEEAQKLLAVSLSIGSSHAYLQVDPENQFFYKYQLRNIAYRIWETSGVEDAHQNWIEAQRIFIINSLDELERSYN
jgi:hypothetical protein